MKYSLEIVFGAVALILLPAFAQASTPDPCSSLGNVVDRPTVTNSVCVVESDHELLEIGYTNQSLHDGGNATNYPQAQLRIGTEIKHLEVDVYGPSEQTLDGLRGESDSGLGLKYLLGYSPRMQYGVQYSGTLPTGSAAFTAGAGQPSYSFNAGYVFSPAITLSTSQIFSTLVSSGTHYASYTPTLSLSASLPHNFSALAEIALFTNAAGPDTSTRTQYLLGSTYAVNSRLQLDVEDTFSTTTATGRYNGLGFGLAYMLH